MEMSSLGSPPVLVRLDDLSQVGEVRRLAASMAGGLGFDANDQGRVALVLTEAATNVIKHAGSGEIVVRPSTNSVSGIEALVVDKGPGIADVSWALRDGNSTAGTPGTGLGAVARLSSKFDVYSAPGSGTVLSIQVWPQGPKRPAEVGAGEVFETGTVCLPHPRESAFGDAWGMRRAGDRVLVIVADGLGHGPEAAAASEQAVRLFQESRADDPAAILAEVHAGLRSTRGAAVAIASLDCRNQEIRYAGVGNIAASVVTGDQCRHMVSHNGTVGHEVRKIQEFQYPFPPEALVIMHSDGLQTHWRLDRYPGLTSRGPAVIAGLLYRDFSRGRDDVTVLALREISPSGVRP
jgi:anti-sigma regulatory factor (Ser/Thr protein kinase)